MLRRAFDIEDKPMIEAAYANVTGEFWDIRPLSLGVDEGALHRSINEAGTAPPVGPIESLVGAENRLTSPVAFNFDKTLSIVHRDGVIIRPPKGWRFSRRKRCGRSISKISTQVS